MTAPAIQWRPQGGRRYPQIGVAGRPLVQRVDSTSSGTTPIAVPPDPGPYFAFADPGRYFLITDPGISQTARVTPETYREFRFDYDVFPEFTAGDTITSATVSSTTAGLAFGPQSIVASGNSGSLSRQVNCGIQGFANNTDYHVKILATTASGAVLSGCVIFSCKTRIDVIELVTPDDNRTYCLDFADYDELKGTDLITSAQAPSVAGLTIATPSIVASADTGKAAAQIDDWIHGFAAATDYVVVFPVATAAGWAWSRCILFRSRAC